MNRTCPKCGLATERSECCGIIFALRVRWRMTKLLIRRVQVAARVDKGLSEEIYRLRVRAVGAESCKDFSREQYHVFMRELAKLPSVRRARSAMPAKAAA